MMSLRKSWGSGGFWFFDLFWPASLIKVAISKFDFDSTPPVARVRPSGLKAAEVTVLPIVPAVIVPSTFVIIALMSAILGRFGIVGIEPGFILGSEPRFGSDPGFGNDPGFAAGAAAAKLRSRFPDAISQSTTSPWPVTVSNSRPSEVKPTSFGAVGSVSVRTSRPEVTSKILTWLEGRPPIVPGPCDS